MPTNLATIIWPPLPYREWRDTLQLVQLWTQIVGKVRLALTPWLNHSWHVPLYVTARGLGTSPAPIGDELLEMELDFIAHELHVTTSNGVSRRLALRTGSVSDFHRSLLATLKEIGVNVSINEMPNEVSAPVRFSDDLNIRVYDAEAARRFWRALIPIDRILKRFRSGFVGKASPVHFFWGSFDLALTRFSGRPAPLHPGGVPGLPDAVVREAYSHEVSSAGFWPGNDAFPQAAFYSYAYPAPPGFERARIGPEGAAYATALGEWVLSYDIVRASASPENALLRFLQDTYDAAATLGAWDRAALECPLGVPRRARPLGGVSK